MNALAAEIARIIARDGPVSVARYVQLCLIHPEHGYYVTRDPFGRGGDFITAPEISQMFGELLGLWAASTWQRMGSPEKMALVELGPGRGTLMADALRAVRVLPAFGKAVTVHLVEASPHLRAVQRRKLADAGAPVSWHDRFDKVPPGPAIVLANEFFDALPVRQFERRETGWHERMVGLSPAGRLTFCLDASVVPALPDIGDQPLGTVAEISAEGLALAFDLGARVQAEGGGVLVIDYGDPGPPLGDTLQAMRAHGFADPLEDPGQADLTTQVRFDALAQSARHAGAAVHGPIAQADFLERLGLLARAEKLKAGATPAAAAAVEAAVRRLTDRARTGMGALFKAMAIVPRGMQAPAGFD